MPVRARKVSMSASSCWDETQGMLLVMLSPSGVVRWILGAWNTTFQNNLTAYLLSFVVFARVTSVQVYQTTAGGVGKGLQGLSVITRLHDMKVRLP